MVSANVVFVFILGFALFCFVFFLLIYQSCCKLLPPLHSPRSAATQKPTHGLYDKLFKTPSLGEDPDIASALRVCHIK